MKAVLERGQSSSLVQKAYYNYLEERYSQASAYYLESAYLGYEVGLVNAAVLLDKYQSYEEIGSLKDIFSSNKVIKLGGSMLNVHSYDKLANLLFEDL